MSWGSIPGPEVSFARCFLRGWREPWSLVRLLHSLWIFEDLQFRYICEVFEIVRTFQDFTKFRLFLEFAVSFACLGELVRRFDKYEKVQRPWCQQYKDPPPCSFVNLKDRRTPTYVVDTAKLTKKTPLSVEKLRWSYNNCKTYHY
jgi:hypothetical protein